MVRYFYDTEFIDDGKTIDLISIGVVREDGAEYYAVVNDNDVMARAVQHPWLRNNVVPHLPVSPVLPFGWHDYSEGGDVYHWHERWTWNQEHPDAKMIKDRGVIAAELATFIGDALGYPELWAYYSAYDHVALAQLWGPMVNLPPKIPMWTRDLMQLWEWAGCPVKPVQATGAHNALADARWNRELWQTCTTTRT